MTLIEECLSFFETKDLYDVLQIKKSAKENEIKKAYYKVSLEVHPDRVKKEDKKAATEKFKILGKVYSILSDKEKRAIYDETGEIDEENLLPENKDWSDYWRLLFKKISISDIKDFEVKYKGSQEEREELKQAYLDGKGDMDHIIENMICATVDDEERFADILNDMISKKEIKAFTNFTKRNVKDRARRKRKADQEAKEAEDLKKQLGIGSTDGNLQELILSRGRQREEQLDHFLDNLAAKYSQKSKQTKKKK